MIMTEKRTLTCIVCPRGCTLEVLLEDGSVSSVKGNICKRGIAYATDECIAPKRTVTTTARCVDGSLIAVKTKTAVPKELVFDVMKAINEAVASSDCRPGDVIISRVAGTDADVVVTGEKYR